MNHMKYKLLVVLGLLAFSCKKSKGLDSLKSELSAKKTELEKIKNEITTIEVEIAKLDPKKDEEAPANVKTEALVPQTFKHYIDLNGVLDTKDVVYASPQSAGTIEKVYVREGDYVKQGQIIAKIDNSILEASLNEIKVQLETAKTLLGKQQSLWDQKIGTEIQLIQAKTQVESLEKRLATMMEQTKLSVAKAPISGQVEEVRQKAGEMASPGMGICKIVNTTNLKVKALVSDSYASSLRKGDQMQVELSDLSKKFNSTIIFVSATVNAMSRTIEVHGTIPGTDAKMKPNMAAKIQILDESKPNSLVIKQNLVQTTENGEVVYVATVEGGKKIARQKSVKTGKAYNGNIVITEGLKAGDMIITEGATEIVDGQLINF